MTQFIYPIPGKQYKKVKTIKTHLHDMEGNDVHQHEVTVYLHAAGTPTFVVTVPAPMAEAWSLHRDMKKDYNWTIDFNDGIHTIHAPDFDTAVRRMETVDYAYATFVRTRTMTKVIAIALEMKADHVKMNAPSFCKTDTLVGISAGIYYQVNRKLYDVSTRAHSDKDKPITFDDLHPSHRHGSYDKIIAYSDEAWETIQKVEATLKKAALMLHDMIKNENTELLLRNGIQNLLAAPSTSTEGVTQ